jgi:hypothetical protein
VGVEKGRPEKFHVLDIGLWMAFERRQAFNQLRWDDRCLAGMFGLPEAARSQRKASAHEYGGIVTYPRIVREHASDATAYASVMKAASALVRARPDLVPAEEWVELSRSSPHGPPAPDLPAYALWFDPYSPFGTAFDSKARAAYEFFRPLRASDFKIVPPAQAEIAPYGAPVPHRLLSPARE